MTIFLTTQYLEEADQLCDRVGIIAGGLLKAEGTPKELKALVGNDIVTVSVSSLKESINARLKAMKSVKKVEQEKSTLMVYMKEASKNIGELVESITSDGSTILELSIRTPSLDDVFLQVTGLRLKGDE